MGIEDTGVIERLEYAKAELAIRLYKKGDNLAAKYGYQTHRELDAVHYFIVTKFGWLPSVVRSMNNDDLFFLLDEEEGI